MPNRFERRLIGLDTDIKTNLVSVRSDININTNINTNNNRINRRVMINRPPIIHNNNNNNDNLATNIENLSSIQYDTEIIDFRIKIKSIEDDIVDLQK